MKELILAALMMQFVSLSTDLPEPKDPPIIRKLSTEKLYHMMFPGQPLPENPADGRILAVHSNGIVYLDETNTLDTPFEHSILVHELVHYAQWHSDSTYACVGEQEAEAYKVQDMFLQKYYKDTINTYIDPLWRIAVSTCSFYGEGQ